MPELPEVEAARRALADHCVGKKIIACSVADDNKVIEGVSSSDLEASLTGKTIVAVYRKGKNLWVRLDSPPFPTFQFGMSGAIYIKGVATTKYKRAVVSDTDEWPSKYSKVFIKLDDGLEFSFTDIRRFARVRLLENPESVPPISELGPDALFEPMPIDEFAEKLSKKNISIKALLLDQSFISGIGNWIADEVLYQARIHPLQSASSLSKESIKTLHSCIKEVVEKAVEVGADSSQYPKDWIFHSREKKPGKAFVDGKKIEFLTAGGRTSAYVPELQKLLEDQAKKAPQRKSRKQSDKAGEKEASGNEEDEGDEDTKLKKPKKATGIAKNQRKKTNDSDGDEEGDEKDSSKTRRLKKATSSAKKRQKKTNNSDDYDDGGGGSSSDYNDGTLSKKPSKFTLKKQAATISSKETSNSKETSRQRKKNRRS